MRVAPRDVRLRTHVRFGFRWIAVAITVALAVAGCGGGGKTGGENAPPASSAQAPPPPPDSVEVRVHDVQGCVEFLPPRQYVRVGQQLIWVANSDLKQQVLITLHAGAFHDSTWTLAPGGRQDAGPALAIGAYDYLTLNLCRIPNEATGPGVDIGDHVGP